MANSKAVYVYVKQDESSLSILAGRLDFFAERVDFRYSKTWLNRTDSFAFHPDLLPLDSAVCSALTLQGG